MKHQQSISNQRIKNMQNGMASVYGSITCLQHRLEAITPKNFAELKDSVLDDVEEINMFLNWVSNQ